jgi:hypothetical protein
MATYIYHDLQYGVMEDRRAKGLGVALLGTYGGLGAATFWRDKRIAQSEFPVTIQVRTVAYTDWRELPDEAIEGGVPKDPTAHGHRWPCTGYFKAAHSPGFQFTCTCEDSV